MKPLTFAWKASFAPTHETGRMDKLITQHSVNLKEKFTQKKNHYPLPLMLMESRVKARSPQNISKHSPKLK